MIDNGHLIVRIQTSPINLISSIVQISIEIVSSNFSLDTQYLVIIALVYMYIM